MITIDFDRLIAQTILQILQDDMDDDGPSILVEVEGSHYVPFDWAEKYAPGLQGAWEKFMNGQTYCEYGYYISDVSRFLRSKVRK